MIKLATLSKVEYLFVDEESRLVYGAASDSHLNIDIFSVKAQENGNLRKGSLKVASLSSQSKVTSVLPTLRDMQMHMTV